MMNSNGTIVFDVLTTENHVLESIADPEHMSQFAYLLTAITLFFIGFFGFFLNLFVIILMCKDIQVSVTTSGNVLLSQDNRK
jgi:H+/Cl- antiporter ClcA